MHRHFATRLLSVALLGASVSACASSNNTPARADTKTVSISGVPGSLRMSNGPASSSANVALPVETVWKIMPAVFDSLSVPIATIDPAKHEIGNNGYKLRQRLGKVSLSRYFDCGTTQIGPNADSYEVVLTVLAHLLPGASGSTNVNVTVEATARPVAFNQAYSQCSSKGQLETRLLDLINTQAGR